MDILILIVFGFLLIWVFVLLPQRRRMATQGRLVEELKVGDEVLTAGGLFGDVTEIGEDEVALEIAPGVEVRVAARAIASVVPPGTYVDGAGAEPEPEVAETAGQQTVDGAVSTGTGPSEPPASAEPGRR